MTFVVASVVLVLAAALALWAMAGVLAELVRLRNRRQRERLN